MRYLLLMTLCFLGMYAQDSKPAVDWSEIDKQMSVLRTALDARDIEAVKNASDALSKSTFEEWQKQALTPSDYLRKAEERVAANPASRNGSLPFLAMMAAQSGAWEKARIYAQDALAATGSAYDTVHDSNNVLGLVALHDGDVASAEAHLLAAGKTKGSTMLKRWGPNLALAKALLDKGRNDVVLEYFQLCKNFVTENPKLEQWIATLKGGHAPDLTHEYLWFL